MRKLPGLKKFSNITLKRGFTKDKDLWKWRKTVMDGKTERQSGSITLLDEARQPSLRWNFREGWPRKLGGPDLQREEQRGGDRDPGDRHRRPRRRKRRAEAIRPMLGVPHARRLLRVARYQRARDPAGADRHRRLRRHRRTRPRVDSDLRLELEAVHQHLRQLHARRATWHTRCRASSPTAGGPAGSCGWPIRSALDPRIWISIPMRSVRPRCG